MKVDGKVRSLLFCHAKEFLTRRIHSLAGLAFLLFLCEHLFTNSQATLFLGDDGKGFVEAVNWIHSLPYLQVIELTFIALPLAIHVWWGIERMLMAKLNANPSDGASSSLPYTRNIAYTWQRITSVILIFAIGLHVYYMRFASYPDSVDYGVTSEYFIKIGVDPGLYTLAPRLNLMLFDKSMIASAEAELAPKTLPVVSESLFAKPEYNAELAEMTKNEERVALERQFVDVMKRLNPDANEVVAVCDSFGMASLMMLRDTFKSVWLCILYSLFVVIACFHGCNGLWTFAITWGVSLSERSRVVLRVASNLLMGLLIFFGLAAVWGVYWINLRY